MRFRILKIGKPAFDQYDSLVQTYVQRIANFYPCECTVIRESDKATQKLTSEWANRGNTLKVFLDILGESLKSEQLSHFIFQQSGHFAQIDFVIGGPYGFPESFLKLPHFKWKLLEGLVTSDLAWLVACEQIYRAVSIKHQTGYHHG